MPDEIRPYRLLMADDRYEMTLAARVLEQMADQVGLLRMELIADEDVEDYECFFGAEWN